MSEERDSVVLDATMSHVSSKTSGAGSLHSLTYRRQSFRSALVIRGLTPGVKVVAADPCDMTTIRLAELYEREFGGFRIHPITSTSTPQHNNKLTCLAPQPLSPAEGGKRRYRQHRPDRGHRSEVLAPNLVKRYVICHARSFRFTQVCIPYLLCEPLYDIRSAIQSPRDHGRIDLEAISVSDEVAKRKKAL